jgi:hypothetical protein
VRWQFARTMPQIPHEYTLREWAPDDAEFESFVVLIREQGVVKPWPPERPRYRHTYLEVDGFDYWTMGADVPLTTVINREWLADPKWLYEAYLARKEGRAPPKQARASLLRAIQALGNRIPLPGFPRA